MSKVVEAISFVRQRLGRLGTIAVGFSGGKDSIATAEIMRLSGVPYRLYYSQTSIDPPELVKFIRLNYPDCKMVRPKRTFFYYVTTNNPPARFSRWCCRVLKKAPLDRLGYRFVVTGIRALESVSRRNYKRVNYFVKRRQIQYYPILNWKEADVWSFIKDQGLAYPTLYDEGIERIGCIVCPNHSYDVHRFYRARWPRYFNLFERAVRQWYEKRKGQGRPMFHDSPEAFLDDWYCGKVRWYQAA